MGRDVTGLRIDKKPNGINAKSKGTFHGVAHAATKVVPERDETKNYEAEDNTSRGTSADECNETQDVLIVKSINHEPEEKILKAEAQKPTDKNLSSTIKPASGSAVKGTTNANSLLKTGNQISVLTHEDGAETVDSGVEYSSKTSDLQSPKSVKISPANSPTESTKTLRNDDNKYHDEDDNWSLASSYPLYGFRLCFCSPLLDSFFFFFFFFFIFLFSWFVALFFVRSCNWRPLINHSTATSVRTCKSKVTVPVAPTFKCTARLERRKEFYTKLEEKHKALEQEKRDYEARTKEEEAAAIKQLRKTMAYKANPVPSFYREGPPPKVELKKLPVTRAKSPNLTRRKSCSDAVKASPEEKGNCARTTRHSIGVYREGKSSPTSTTPKSKNRVSVRNANATSKARDRPQQVKDTTKKSHTADQESADMAVVS